MKYKRQLIDIIMNYIISNYDDLITINKISDEIYHWFKFNIIRNDGLMYNYKPVRVNKTLANHEKKPYIRPSGFGNLSCPLYYELECKSIQELEYFIFNIL